MKNRKLSIVVLSLFFFCLCVVRADAQPIQLKFAGQNPPNHHSSLAMEEIAKEVAEKTGNLFPESV